jgi:hypothetical protein
MARTELWSELLSIELGTITDEDLIEPTIPIQPGEAVVGRMTQTLKKLWTRLEQMKAETLRCQADAKIARNDRERKKAEAKTIEIQVKSTVLEALFLIAIRDEFRLWKPVCVGVRRGWEVVTSEPSGPTLPNFLKHILGLE